MTDLSVTDKPADLPANVPPELVRPYPLAARARTYENPFETLIPEVHRGPEVFYATDVYTGGKPGWVIRRAEDLRAVYLDTDNFSKKGFSGFAASIGEDWDVIPTELDPPRHSAFRAVLNPIFAPKRLAAFEDRVRQRAREWVAGFKDRSECDFVAAFASPYPVSIFLELMGLPQDGMAQFLAWEHDLLHNPDMVKRGEAVRAVKGYLLDAIDDRRRNPKDDLITNATTALVDGRPFTDIEVLGHCFNLYVGGLDTVASNLSLHFYHLASHPQDQRALRDDPSSISTGVEELLRAYAAVTTFRICAKEYQLKGVTFMPGDKVAMATPLGGRDPGEYDHPNEVRLDREPTHLVFGYGAHRCLGSHLARRELNIALEEVLAAIPEFRIAPGAAVPFFTGGVIHVEELPLVWGRA